MSPEKFELLLRNIGNTYSQLVTEEVIEAHPLQMSEYEDCDSLEIEAIPGLELVFSEITYRLEHVYVRLRNDSGCNLPLYTGGLPEPFRSIRERKHAHQLLGKPISSRLEEFYGSDLYQLDPKLHPETQIHFQYGTDSTLKVIAFSLFGA